MITPSHSIEIEQKLLGGLLAKYFNPDFVMGEVSPAHFYTEAHQALYIVIRECFDSKVGVDVVSVPERAKDLGLYECVGGVPYINELALAAYPCSLDYLLQSLKEHYIKREALTACLQLMEDYQEVSALDLLQGLRSSIDEIAKAGITNKESSNDDLKAKAIDEVERKLRGELLGLPSGFKTLDYMLDGFSAGDLVVLAARPGMGKTSLGVNIASNVAKESPVLFFTLEMPAHQIIKKVIISEAETRTNISKLSLVKLPDNLKVIEAPGVSIEKVRGIIAKYKAVFGKLGLVVIDYLGLIQAPGNSVYERTKIVSNSLKRIALEFEIPVLALAQLSRATEGRADKHPIMSDLRDSGDIEQDADKIIMLYRYRYYNPEADSSVDVGLLKNRAGSVGQCRLDFREELTKFYDLEVI